MDKHIDNDKVIEIDYEKLLGSDLLELDIFSQKTDIIEETTKKPDEKIQIEFDKLDTLSNQITDEFSIDLNKHENNISQNDPIKIDFDSILESLIANNTPEEIVDDYKDDILEVVEVNSKDLLEDLLEETFEQTLEINSEVIESQHSSKGDLNDAFELKSETTIDPKTLPQINKKQSKTEKSFFSRLVIGLLCSVIGGSCIGFTFGIGLGLVSDSRNNSVTASVKQQDNIKEESLSFNNAIKKAEPSVVPIQSVKNSNQSSEFVSVATEEAMGSGILYSEDKDKVYIVTNRHVIADTKQIKVYFNSNFVNALLVGESEQNDLAVIYVLKSDLKKFKINKVSIAEFLNPSNIKTGDLVLAIGNALGEGNSSTFGMVSAVNKKVVIDALELDVIQIDAPINPGNSGGALVNLNGKIIGINTAKSDRTVVDGEAYILEGTSYSICTDVFVPIINKIIEDSSKDNIKN